MADENGTGAFNPQASEDGNGTPSPQPETPLVPPEDTGEEPQPKYVTEDTLKSTLESFERRMQSSRDSALGTFDKRIKAKIEQVEKDVKGWREQGVTISPEQEQQRRMKALEEVMLENPDTNQPSGQPGEATQGVPDEAVVKETNARAAQIMQQTGIQIEDGDPELVLLDQTSPEAYLASLRNALYQKGLRAGSTQSSAPPEARIPSMGQGRKPTTDIEKDFLKEYQAAEGKGLEAARQIRQKYMSKGVDVPGLIDQNYAG